MSAVLDASALLAYILNEPSGEKVDRVLEDGAFVGTVNWAELLSRLTDLGREPESAAQALAEAGISGGVLAVRHLDEAQALEEIARLRPFTRAAGLSPADRACLALAASPDLPALTADRIWAGLDLTMRVDLIR